MKTTMRRAALAALAAFPIVIAITPEQMLAAPRRSDLSPDPTGEFAIFTSTTYDWDEHGATLVWNRIDLATGEISLLYNGSDISEIVWVGSSNSSVLYINGTNDAEDGGISIYSANITALDEGTLIASLPAPYSGLKAVQTESGDINFLLNCLSYPNGTAYNEALVEEPYSSGRIYDSIYVRHWDTWLTENKFAVFAGTITGGTSFDGNLTNLVTALSNVTQAETPVQPFGDSGDYDISPDGSTVAFLTKNIDLSLANFTSSQIYLVPHDGSRAPVAVNGFSGPSTPPNAQGASSQPHFSPDGTYIAYLQMDGISYESDKNKIYIANVDFDNFTITTLAEDWDSTPDHIEWSPDGSSLFLTAPDLGNSRIFEVPITAGADYKPTNITNQGVVAGYHFLPDGNLVVSDAKIWSSRDMYIISTNGTLVTDLFHANEVDEGLAGLGPQDVAEFYTQGSFTQVQSWIVYPTGFDRNQTYPLAFIVHGGPQGAHFNTWSTRWNFKVWADQGYVVVAPNPTGSTGWGMAFQDAIQNNWGSYPYEDLVACWNYVNTSLPYVDTANGIEAGASYGGYMTNWIQGHDLGREFKALVTHDGVTSTENFYATEELWFIQRDLNGTFWDNRENYQRFNPVDHIANWSTPHFVIHNDLDFRLPVSEGIMLFNILQEIGVPSKFLNFPDENHWVLNRENSLVWHTEIFKWINYWSGVSNSTGP